MVGECAHTLFRQAALLLYSTAEHACVILMLLNFLSLFRQMGSRNRRMMSWRWRSSLENLLFS